MFPTSLATTPRLPKDAAVLDPTWAEIHRVVRQVVSKKFEPGTGTLGITSPSYTSYRITTACDQEFSTRTEPAPGVGMPGPRCTLCYPAASVAA
jgi:hypothetical protein